MILKTKTKTYWFSSEKTANTDNTGEIVNDIKINETEIINYDLILYIIVAVHVLQLIIKLRQMYQTTLKKKYTTRVNAITLDGREHFMLLIVILGLVVILSITVNCMIKFSIQPQQTTKSHHFSIVKICGTFLRSLIETSIPVLPKNKIIQWIYGTWFAACLIISCYFNTTLVSHFTTPGHLKQIKTVQDIIDSKIPIAMDPFINYLVTARYGTSYFATRNLNSTMPIGLKLASMGEAATFTDIMRAQHMSVQWVSSTGESSIYYIEEYELKYWITTVIYRGNPLKERIADIASKMM